MTRIFEASAACMLLVACQRQPSPTNFSAENMGPAADQPAPTRPTPPPTPVLIGGLQPAEAASISTEASAFLRQKRFDSIAERLHWGQPPGTCGSHFGLENGQIVDASLGPQSGRVQIIVPITPTVPVRAYNGGPVYPGLTCFGVQREMWVAGRTLRVAFQFNIERWQTGWRLSQIQSR